MIKYILAWVFLTALVGILIYCIITYRTIREISFLVMILATIVCLMFITDKCIGIIREGKPKKRDI